MRNLRVKIKWRLIRFVMAQARMLEGRSVVAWQDLLVVIRRYQPSDYDQVGALWSRINRELAPTGMEELFEQYIATTISGELVRLSEVFSEAKKNAFWVVDHQAGSSAALVSSLTVRPTPNYAGCI